MYQILNNLNKIEGARGSLIIGRDGLVIAADLGTEVNENAVAAVGSQILNSLQGALRRMQMGSFKRFVPRGSRAAAESARKSTARKPSRTRFGLGWDACPWPGSWVRQA